MSVHGTRDCINGCQKYRINGCQQYSLVLVWERRREIVRENVEQNCRRSVVGKRLRIDLSSCSLRQQK